MLRNIVRLRIPIGSFFYMFFHWQPASPLWVAILKSDPMLEFQIAFLYIAIIYFDAVFFECLIGIHFIYEKKIRCYVEFDNFINPLAIASCVPFVIFL